MANNKETKTVKKQNDLKANIATPIKSKENDNSKKSQDKEIKITFTPSLDKTEPLSVKKTKQQIESEQKEVKINFANQTGQQKPNPTGMEDINGELGVFKSFSQETEKEQKENLAKQEENLNALKKEINFEKFEKKKAKKKIATLGSKSKFGEKVNLWLRDKKSLRTVWIIESIIISIFVIMLSLYIAFISPNLNFSGNGPFNIEINKSCAFVGYIFSIIGLVIIPLPFLFLITSWFVGINGVASSKQFHYSIWLSLIIAFVFVIIASGLCLSPLIQNMAFPGQ